MESAGNPQESAFETSPAGQPQGWGGLALIPGDLDYLGATVPGPVQWEGDDSLCEAGWVTPSCCGFFKWSYTHGTGKEKRGNNHPAVLP